MGVTQSEEAWRQELEDIEGRILRLGGLNLGLARRTYTSIEMEGAQYQVRTIYYKSKGSVAGSTQRRTLVMTHGYMSCCTTFLRLLKGLSEKYDLVLFDNCGWGLNTRLKASKATESQEAAIAWMTEFMIKTITALYLPETFLLAGHSYGGFLCSLFAQEQPERVESLFLLSPCGVETKDPANYEPLAYNDQLEPHKNLDPSWEPYQLRVKKYRLHPLGKVHMLPKFFENLGYYLLAFAFSKKLQTEGHPADLIAEMRAQKEISLRRWSVIDVAQLLPLWAPQMVDPAFCLHKRLTKVDIPIAIAFGDRDFLCSRGADELIKGSKHFKSGASQLFKIADSSHHLQQDQPSEVTKLMIGHFEGTVRGNFQEKARGEYRLIPGRIFAKPDIEKYLLRFLCVALFAVLVYQNLFKGSPAITGKADL